MVVSEDVVLALIGSLHAAGGSRASGVTLSKRLRRRSPARSTLAFGPRHVISTPVTRAPVVNRLHMTRILATTAAGHSGPNELRRDGR